MKSKFFVLMSVALVTLMLSLAVSAQRKNDKNDKNDKPIVSNPGIAMKPKVMLSCAAGGGKDVSTPFNVKNLTAADIPSGKVIYWSAKVNGGGTANDKQTL